MGMIFAEHFSDYPGALLIWLVVIETKLRHSEKNSSVSWLEAVTHIGKRACHDDRHRIIYVRAFYLVFYIDRN